MKIARFAIFLTGMIGLAMGGIMSISSLQSQQEETVVKTNEALKNQSQLLVDQFFATLEAAKAAAPNANLPFVTHRAVIKLTNGTPDEVESITSNTANSAGEVDIALEERVLSAVKTQLSMTDLQISKISLGTFLQSDVSSREGIYIATPIYRTSAIGLKLNEIEKVSLLMIDPAKALAGLTKTAATDRNSFLINKNGRVLAHTIPAYVGTDLKKVDSLKETIEGLFLGAQTGNVGRYQSVDGTKEQVAFVRAGTYPFAIATEQPVPAPVLSLAWASDQIESGAARKGLGTIFILIAAALAAFAAISYGLSRELKKQIASQVGSRLENEGDFAYANSNLNHAASNLNADATNVVNDWTPDLNLNENLSKVAPPSFGQMNAKIELEAVGAQPALNPLIGNATDAFVENRVNVVEAKNNSDAIARTIQSSSDLMREFTGRIQQAYAVETIERETVQAASILSHSSVLFFRYQRKNQMLNLAAVAGSVHIPNYAHMQAYVRKDIEQQVETLANEGKVASITNYGPLSKLMLSHLNLTGYEAWTVTSDAEVSGASKLVGVVVVVQPRFEQNQARQALAKILREAGNYLYAHNRKIKPRTIAQGQEIDLGLNPNA